MARNLTKQRFQNLVMDACIDDPDLRHQIERERNFDTFQSSLEIAYDLVSHHFLSIREAFGLTERGR